jgi:hypothetical protein
MHLIWSIAYGDIQGIQYCLKFKCHLTFCRTSYETEDPFVVKVVFVLNRICHAQNFVLAKHYTSVTMWLHTGHISKMTMRKYLCLVRRSKNMLFKCVFTRDRRKYHQSRIFDRCQFYPQFVQIDMASLFLYTSYASHWAPLCVRSCQLLALTGCDTTSSFFGIGKKSIY